MRAAGGSFSIERNSISKFCRKCARGIRAEIEGYINFVDTPKLARDNPTLRLVLKQGYATRTAEPTEPTESLVRLGAAAKGIYWIAAHMIFSQHFDQYQFREVSLRVSRSDIASDPEPVHLFRAEWVFPIDDSWTDHAQPHWHILEGEFWRKKYNAYGEAVEGLQPETQRAGIQESGDHIGFDQPKTFRETGGQGQQTSTLDRFHFAMAAQWHAGGDHRVRALSEDGFIKWIAGCLKYVRGQLELQ